MHLGNGAITPECGMVALGTAAVGAGLAWRALRKAPLSRHQAWTAGAMGAAVFAAQMFNVSVLPFGSAHLVGGVLLAWTLGPSLGLLTMAAILTVQAVALADGGLLALGVNTINMGVVPAVLVAGARRWLRDGHACANVLTVRSAVALCAISVISMTAAAGLVVAELALFRTGTQLAGISTFAWQMLAAYAVIGCLEGAVTVGLVTLIAHAWRPSAAMVWELTARQATLLGAVALAVAIVSLPSWGLTSSVPDGYETALRDSGRTGIGIGTIESSGRLVGWNANMERAQQAIACQFDPFPMATALWSTTFAGLASGILACSRVSRKH